LVTAAALIAMALVGWSVSAADSVVFTLLVAVCLLPALWLVPSIRFPFVIIGGLTILYSSSSLDKPKFLYLAGMLVVCAVALRQLPSRRATKTFRRIYPLLVWSWIWFLVVCISVIVGIAQRHELVDIVRDAAPYVLICSVPLIVFGTYEHLQGFGTALFLAAGIASAVSFTAFILVRRFVVLPFDHVVLPSALLPAALYCFATSKALHESEHRFLWSSLAVAIWIAFLASGSRTYLVLLAALVVMFLLETSTRRQLIKTAGVTLGITLILIAGFYAARTVAGIHGASALDRFLLLPHFISDPGADTSLQERIAQTKVAFQAFTAHPVLGVGLGERFVWTMPSGTPVVTFNLDTTVSYAAKFGLVGIVALAGVGWTWVRLASESPRVERVVTSASLAFLAVTVCLFPLATPMEDKGFSFGLMFLLSIALSSGPVAIDAPTREREMAAD
jgi:hypothetical protein